MTPTASNSCGSGGSGPSFRPTRPSSYQPRCACPVLGCGLAGKPQMAGTKEGTLSTHDPGSFVPEALPPDVALLMRSHLSRDKMALVDNRDDVDVEEAEAWVAERAPIVGHLELTQPSAGHRSEDDMLDSVRPPRTTSRSS